LETGSCFKRIAELTMELVDPNRMTGASSTVKIPADSSEIKRLREALTRFSTDLDGVSQRIQTNRETSAALHEMEKLMNNNSVEETITTTANDEDAAAAASLVAPVEPMIE